MQELLTAENVVLGVLALCAFVMVVVMPSFAVFVTWVSMARRKRQTRGMREGAEALGLTRGDQGWAGTQIGGLDTTSQLFVSRWGPSSARDFIQTKTRVSPVGGRLVVFNGCIHPKGGGVRPWIGDWFDRPLPDGGTFCDGIRGKGGLLVPVAIGDADFEEHFHAFAVDTKRAKAILEGDVARALVSARRPSEYFWFDGETLEALVDLDDRNRGGPFDWPGTIREQRERVAHVATIVGARVRSLSH